MPKPKWNVASPRKYGQDNDKTFWVSVGSAWENTGDGKHFATITLDALPLPDHEGKVRIFLFEKDDNGERRSGETRTERSGAGRRPKSGRTGRSPADDDEIPF